MTTSHTKGELPVDIWDMGNPKGPVKGGAGCSVEDAGDAASLGISASLKKVGCFHLIGSYHKKISIAQTSYFE